MKKIVYYSEEMRGYEGFEEAKSAVSLKYQDIWERTANVCLTKFMLDCVKCGAKLIYPETAQNYLGVETTPLIEFNNVLMRAYRKGNGNTEFFDTNPVRTLVNDDWESAIEPPKRIGTPTAKKLAEWAKYISDKHQDTIAHIAQEKQERASRESESRAKLLALGFEPYYKYETPKEAKKYICKKNGTRCTAEINNQGDIYRHFEIDWQTISVIYGFAE